MPGKANRKSVSRLVFITIFIMTAIIWGYLIKYAGTYKNTVCKNWNELQYETVQEIGRVSEEWINRRVNIDGATVKQAEDEVRDKIIRPIKLLQNGDALFYNKDYLIFDSDIDTQKYRGRSINEIAEELKKDGIIDISILVDAVNSRTNGIGSITWNKTIGEKYIAWTSISVNGNSWTIGILTSESELLNFSGYYRQSLIIFSFATLITVLVFIIWILLIFITKDNEKKLVELEKIVETRTEELQTLNRQLIEEVGKVKHISIHDSLTGIYNRSYFEEYLRSVDKPEYLPLSIISGDVNGLKLINDAFGHQAGDELLKEICKVIKRSCDINDFVARIGGDEFVIIMVKTDEAAANEKVQKIKAGCNIYVDNLFVKSISLGAATKNDPDKDIHDVYKHAEDRMYRNKLVESRTIRSSIITTLRKTLKERTFETEEHCRRIKDNARKIGEALMLTRNQLDVLELLALLHDIGKMSVPEEILKKDGELTNEEQKIMKKHAETGYRIASATPELLPIADGILHHHENYDGTGYPQKLKGEEIPLNSRILAVADAYDVYVYGRNKESVGTLTSDEALEQLKKDKGILYDPKIVDIFTHIIKDGNEKEKISQQSDDNTEQDSNKN